MLITAKPIGNNYFIIVFDLKINICILLFYSIKKNSKIHNDIYCSSHQQVKKPLVKNSKKKKIVELN